jgi:serine/threonine protein kinase
MATSDCPEPTVVAALLSGNVDVPDRAAVLRHVEGCPACRSVLDRLLDRTQSQLQIADCRLQIAKTEELLSQPQSEKTDEPTPSSSQSAICNLQSAIAPAALAFLDPPAQDGSLGRLGAYEILQVLGQGSVGIVLKGYEPTLRRHVAIKVLAPQLLHSVSARRRFAREGRATAALEHANIVSVHAVEEHGPRLCLVMDYIPGLSLQQRLDSSGALPLTEAVRIAAGVAAGLAAAHAAGLIHRDVKPGNVLLEADGGSVKLTDFGLVQEEQGGVSQTDVLAGTPLYMSPEQARGAQVDARGDLFSLGSLLYVMCTGRPPFSGGNPLAVLRQVSEAQPRPVRQVNPNVPRWLADLIVRLHAKDPQSRPTAAEVARVLEQQLANASLVAPPRRWRRWLAATAVLAVAGLALAEAGGLTDLRARARSWLDGRGTLLISSDDPEAVVRLAGRTEELQGASSEAWSLPPGEYLLLTSLPGQSRQEELIQLGRRDRRVFHVERAPARLDGPFVVLSGQGGRERGFASLGEALGQVRAGDTIEVRGNGPFVVPPLRLTRPLFLRAGEGFHPVLRHDGRDPRLSLIETDRPLVLEGLTLEAPGVPKGNPVGLIHSQRRGAALAIANCRLQMRGSGVLVLFEDGPMLEVHRSLLLRGDSYHGAVEWYRWTTPRRVVIDGCVLAGGDVGALITEHLPGKPATQVFLRHSTVVTRSTFLLAEDLRPWAAKPPAHPPLRIEVADSILAASGAVFELNQLLKEKEAPLPPVLASSMLPKLVAYRDLGSFYPETAGLLQMMSRWQPMPSGRGVSTLREWWSFWRQPASAEALQGRIVFQGGDLRARLVKDVAALPVEDFRLAPGNPGRGAARDGKDFGADVGLLGPGEPYQRWRQTPEYADWRRVAQRLLDRPEAPAKERQ